MAHAEWQGTISGGPAGIDDVVRGSIAGVRGMKVVDSLEGRIVARHRFGIWSWGEDVEVSWRPATEGILDITITSASRVRTTLVDWGQNRRNVAAVRDRLLRQVQS